MLEFFRTDVQWSERFSDVWLWMEWPDRRGRPDTGVDLVAVERESGDSVAIQCKFYDPASTIYKEHIDSFLSESGKRPFAQRLIVTTTDRWGRNAEAAIENQQIPVQRLRFMDLAESSIDWTQFDLSTPDVMELKERKQLRPHQQVALENVRAGLGEADRGKLIMACGTGKTFTSLRIAEDLVGVGGRVLFLVPSISLLSQSLREWSLEAELELRPFAVCSDTKIGKRTRAQEDEDISVVDLALPSTTDPDRLHAHLSNVEGGEGRLTVVFSTYQSLSVVAAAQARGLEDFDLIICDEAHRTTGATLAGEDESAFVRVHDNNFIKAAKRLYMTATPRIYDDTSKAKAGQAQAVIASMDDDTLYGPELHRLGFGEAVTRGLLTDYKVLVLAVDEKEVAKTFQIQLADENSELRLDDVAKIVGCWNGLAKRGHAESGFGEDIAPMTRAVAFAGSIAKSKQFAEMFREVTAEYLAAHERDEEVADAPPLACEVEHVDGTYNVLLRNERLDWLKAETEPGTCRILSNARCLSEGVDVPALDSVMFLNPRKSVVDVVQSVGRVMRRAPGKHYGYIILPIGIPAGMTPEEALRDNTKYQVVWEVLQALRAHDERFNAMVNKIELNRTRDDRIQIIGVGGGAGDSDGTSTATAVQGVLNLQWLDEWRDAIYAKIVTKVGDRRYWEDWAQDIAAIAEAHRTRIAALLADPTTGVQAKFDEFLMGLRGNLNESITPDDAVDMLAQHLITRPVFDALFEGHSFAENNPVSQVMQAMLEALDAHNLDRENDTLDRFYQSVRIRAEGIDNAEGKQRIISDLYEKFFKIAFPRTAASLGIVYTPVEVVDFILRSVEHLLRSEFGVSISDSGVHVLDPFTGTGTFVVRLLESGIIQPHDVARKYAKEIHANEILLLAYYIAAINIEATYHALGEPDESGPSYEPFGGIVLTDTFQMTEVGDTLDTQVFPTNNERAARQLDLDIRVIVGNPPWSVGQSSQNDDNANLKYESLDAAIESTYAARSSAGLKRNLYDSYIRGIRWASDRIASAGIVGFVTNGGFLDARSTDGLRLSLAGEFASIYVFNLRGNQRTVGEMSKREGGKIFGSGSRSSVAITLLVKRPEHVGPATIRYFDIGEYLSREQKLAIVDRSDISQMDWAEIEPNAAGDWINQRGASYASLLSLAPEKGPAGARGVFKTSGPGISTSRDAWVYGFSSSEVERLGRETTKAFNEAVAEVGEALRDGRTIEEAVKEVAARFASRISWSAGLLKRLERRASIPAGTRATVPAAYRPFCAQRLLLAPELIERPGWAGSDAMSGGERENPTMVVMGTSASEPFSVLMTRRPPNFHFMNSGTAFPRWRYEAAPPSDGLQAGFDLSEDGIAAAVRLDNIAESSLARFRSLYGAQVDGDAVFAYVYGVLHSPSYRETFADDLKKVAPRIPLVTKDQFVAFVNAGQRLLKLHGDYEQAEPFPLEVSGSAGASVGEAAAFDWYRVEKMRHPKRGRDIDRSVILYNSRITVSGIPLTAQDYLLGSRSAIAWVMERYQVKRDKAFGIVQDPNEWSREVGNPRYILDLLARVTTISLESLRIMSDLPVLEFESVGTEDAT
ncbi:MAG: N-6 DNA methylase [Frankiales bacterium]|nr:N-6 DNA methylase [Frankiales bacterium]